MSSLINKEKLEYVIRKLKEKFVTRKEFMKVTDAIDTPPTYVKPSCSITLNASLLKHNVSTALTIKPNFVKNDAGNVVEYILKKGEEELVSSATLCDYVDTVQIAHNSTITYNITIKYADGVIKQTLLGLDYPETSIKAGSVNSNKSIKAYANSYYGVITGNSITEEEVKNLTSSTNTSKSYTATFNLTNQRSVFLYPASFGILSTIKDANNFDYINSYTRSEMVIDGVDYYVYILTDPVTISNFKQIFN